MGLFDSIRRIFNSPEPKKPSLRDDGTANPARDISDRPNRHTHEDNRHESVYISDDLAKELLVPNNDGLPPLHFTTYQGAEWLAEDTSGKLVNVQNRYLRRIGVWASRVRGDQHYPNAAKLGPAEFVREPDNEHDPNAIAIYSDGAKIGYVNKQKAVGLTKLLDAGTVLQVRIISVDPPKWVAAEPHVMTHLRRKIG